MGDAGRDGLWRRLTPALVAGGLGFAFMIGVGSYLVRALPYERAAALRPACASNLNQTAKAIQFYAADNDGLGPPAAWVDALAPRMKVPELLCCPAVYRRRKDAYGYAFHRSLLGRGFARVDNPQTQPLVFDGSALTRNAVGTLADLPNPPRHGDSNVIAYADGHVKPTGRPRM